MNLNFLHAPNSTPLSGSSGSLCPGPCESLSVFFLYACGSAPPAPPSITLSLPLLLQWECIRRVWTWEKHTGRRNGEDYSSLIWIIWDCLVGCVCACQQVQCLPRHYSRWAAGGDVLLSCSLFSCCLWLQSPGTPWSTSHPNVSTGFDITLNMLSAWRVCAWFLHWFLQNYNVCYGLLLGECEIKSAEWAVISEFNCSIDYTIDLNA